MWSRNDKIALFGVVLAVIAIIASIYQKEIRVALGADPEVTTDPTPSPKLASSPSPVTGLASILAQKSDQIATPPKPTQIPTYAPEATNKVDGIWDGEWAGSDTVFVLSMSLKLTSDNQVNGSINWILKSTGDAELRQKIGQKAIEFVRGTFEREVSSIKLQGYKKWDPQILLELGNYRLFLSDDGNTLHGVTFYAGKIDGKFSARRRR